MCIRDSHDAATLTRLDAPRLQVIALVIGLSQGKRLPWQGSVSDDRWEERLFRHRGQEQTQVVPTSSDLAGGIAAVDVVDLSACGDEGIDHGLERTRRDAGLR